MGDKRKEFNDFRDKMNKKILESDNKVMKRFFSLDTLTYQKGALDVKTKEILGLVSSLVLRCDDCVKYHLEKCFEQGLTTPELFDVFSIANVAAGSVVIPHTRRALEYWEELVNK